MRLSLLIVAAVAVASTACSRNSTLRCEASERYATASSSAPVQIPDDLSPPNESDAIRLPPPVAEVEAPSQPCLEAPPAFFESGRPGQAAPAPAAAPEPPAAEPAAPADSPERVIGN